MSKQKTKAMAKEVERELARDAREIREGGRNEISHLCQNYLKAIVDTKNAPKVGVPTSIGGHPGSTAIYRFKEELTMTVGTSTYGYLSVSPAYPGGASGATALGPFSDSNCLAYSSTAAYAGAQMNQSGSVAAAGETFKGWSQSPFSLAGLAQANNAGVAYRCVGCTIEVFPESSFSSQNGELRLLEIPSHSEMNTTVGAFDYTLIGGYPQTRVVRATQTGPQSEKIVLNWHPRSNDEFDHSRNDFNFLAPYGVTPGTGCPVANGLFLLAIAAAGTQFHCTVTVMYECKGINVPGIKPRLVDSRGMDLIQNAIATKMLSGYVGKPEHVYEGYLAKAWHTAKRVAGWASAHEKELMDSAATVARTVAGFL